MLRFITGAAAAAALVATTPLSAKVAETSEDGFVTQDMADVAATPLETWLALIKPGDWWNDAHTWSADAANMTLAPQAGGCFCERIPGEDRDDGFSLDGSAQHAIVIQAYPLKSLRMRGGLGPLQSEPATGVLTVTLEEIDGGTRIRWEYNVGGPMRFEVDTISKAVDGVMSQQLQGLRDHLGALGTAGEVETDESSEIDDTGEPNIGAQIDAMDDTE